MVCSLPYYPCRSLLVAVFVLKLTTCPTISAFPRKWSMVLPPCSGGHSFLFPLLT